MRARPRRAAPDDRRLDATSTPSTRGTSRTRPTRRSRRSPTSSRCTRCWSATTSAGEDAYGLDALERNLLEVAIRSVYARAARDGVVPRERLLREELRRRADARGRRPAPRRSPSVLRTLGRADRVVRRRGLLRLPARPRDHRPGRRAAGRLRHAQGAARAVRPRCCSCSPSTSPDASSAAAPSACARPTAALFAGRSMLVIDEAWKLVERRATGEWVNEIARRSRHLGLFLVAISPAALRLRRPLRPGAAAQLHPAAVPAPVPRRARLHPGRRPALRRRGRARSRGSRPSSAPTRRPTGSTAPAAAARSRCGSGRPSTGWRPPTPSTTSRAAPRRSKPRDGDAWRALEQLAAEGWETHR